MVSAEEIGDALTPSLLTTLVAGEPRPVAGLELVEAGVPETAHPGDLVVAVGARDTADLLAMVEAVGGSCAGLVARRGRASEPAVLAACRERGLTLLGLADDATLSAAVTILRDVVEQTVRTQAAERSDGGVYADLFALADVLSAVLDAPVTIEDARSRVLAYSSGQHGIDDARTSTIIGRQVPREVRDHFRSLGVFRRIAQSDEPVFVPAGAQVKARLVIPVRAGGEWLGSVWAVVPEQPAAEVVDRARAAAEVLALHFLRLRTRGELQRRLERERVRAVLRGDASGLPGAGSGPWRAVALTGPRTDLDAEERVTLWAALARRSGWRAPVLCDLDELVYAVVEDGPAATPGSWPWLRALVEAEAEADAAPGPVAGAGGAVASAAGLAESAAQARELVELPAGVRPVRCLEQDWPQVVLARARHGVAAAAPVSPIAALAAQDREHDSELVATLCAVIDHWGEPQRAARALGVHPNTVRNRLARLARDLPVDLEDPAVRLALRLEALRLAE